MKHLHTYTIISLLWLFAGTVFAQSDTIVGWTFPDGTSSATANYFIAENSGRTLHTDDPQRTLTFNAPGKEGGTDKCAQTVDWNNGSDIKFWKIDFTTSGYTNIKLSSIQRSCSNHHGPRDFKVQYKLLGQTDWTDIPNTNVVDTSNWTKGTLENIALPIECENQSQPMSIRWLMTSNLDIKGETVLNTGMSRIDNVFITGDKTLNINNNETFIGFNVYPNPVDDNFSIIFSEECYTKNTLVYLINASGQICKTIELNRHGKTIVDLSYFQKGYYILQLQTSEAILTKKIIKL